MSTNEQRILKDSQAEWDRAYPVPVGATIPAGTPYMDRVGTVIYHHLDGAERSITVQADTTVQHRTFEPLHAPDTSEQPASKDEEIAELETRLAKLDAIAQFSLDKWGTTIAMLGELEHALTRVRELHQPIDYPGDGIICCDCENPYPCPTINTIKGCAE